MNMLIQTNFSAWRKVETVLTFFFSTDRMGRHHELLSKTLPKVLDHNHHLNVLIIMKIQAFNMQLSMFSQRYKGNGSTSKSVLERASTKWRVLLRVRLHEALHCPFWAKIGSVDSQSDQQVSFNMVVVKGTRFSFWDRADLDTRPGHFEITANLEFRIKLYSVQFDFHWFIYKTYFRECCCSFCNVTVWTVSL